MENISRKQFLSRAGFLATSMLLFNRCGPESPSLSRSSVPGVKLESPRAAEDIFTYVSRIKGKFDLELYRQVLGAANAFKEGDLTLGIAAADEDSRRHARDLLARTRIGDLEEQPVYQDELQELIRQTTLEDPAVWGMTLGELKSFVLEKPEAEIKEIMPSLSSDTIACLVKLLDNDELIQVGQKVFNPLPGSQIGSKGYLSARIQPNSPTDNIEDIQWQVFDAWSYAVGDLVLGTNPVSSEPESVARIEQGLFDVLSTFGLENVLPNCVLSHIDIQAEVEELQPGTTGIWFQSLAGTVNANRTFDLSIEKMFEHASQRDGRYGLYAETGQGADFTNGHGEGFDMVIHEARKYGFLRALKQDLGRNDAGDIPWVHVNDVAGFIGPEVFRTREQLVRCCLEDTVMGKLHGLCIGLDICSTLHMDVDLDDLDWCMEQVMPANPAYLMALPTKNDPMLSYLTTAFSDHLRIREKFGYKVNDAMWTFFKKLGVIDPQGKPTEHFGDPVWVYYQFRKAKGDTRNQEAIYREGREALARIRGRGVPIAEGYGDDYWVMDPELDREIRTLYEDAKVSLWSAMEPAFVSAIPGATPIFTRSSDRQDYVYHPESGEKLSPDAVETLNSLRNSWGDQAPDLQIIISDGLNARALMDEGHLLPYLDGLRQALAERGYRVGLENIVITHGRVRAGYACGEVLFGKEGGPVERKGIIHIIGERPGSGHHNFSAYLTAADTDVWGRKGVVDHNISRVVSGISDTSLKPEEAVRLTVGIFDQLFKREKEEADTGADIG